MESAPASRPVVPPVAAASLDAPDAALAAVVTAPPDDTIASLDAAGLAAEADVSEALLDAVIASGILPPHHVDADGIARYSAADAAAVRAGRSLLDAGLPLPELLALAEVAGPAITAIAERAVDTFIAYVRDPVVGTSTDDEAAAARLVAAYETMLPATERIVAHHLRRRLIGAALDRLAQAGDAPA
jgi:hypothetical protein